MTRRIHRRATRIEIAVALILATVLAVAACPAPLFAVAVILWIVATTMPLTVSVLMYRGVGRRG